MKKNLTFHIKLVFLVTILFFSCTREEMDKIYDEGSLNSTGQALMNIIKTNPNWEKSWNEISKKGKPLPNEGVGICTNNGMAFYVIPVVEGKEITQLAFYPINIDIGKITRGITDEKATIGDPEIIDKDSYAGNDIARLFIKSETIKEWKEKGYSSSFKELPVQVSAKPKIQTRSIGSLEHCSYSTEVYLLFYFNYYSIYEISNIIHVIYNCVYRASNTTMSGFYGLMATERVIIDEPRYYETSYFVECDPIRVHVDFCYLSLGWQTMISDYQCRSWVRSICDRFRQHIETEIKVHPYLFNYNVRLNTFESLEPRHLCSEHISDTDPNPEYIESFPEFSMVVTNSDNIIVGDKFSVKVMNMTPHLVFEGIVKIQDIRLFLEKKNQTTSNG